MSATESQKASAKRRYDDLKERGLCVKCGDETPVEGQVRCADCRDLSDRTKLVDREAYNERQRDLRDARLSQAKAARKANKESKWLARRPGESDSAYDGRITTKALLQEAEAAEKRRVNPELIKF